MQTVFLSGYSNQELGRLQSSRFPLAPHLPSTIKPYPMKKISLLEVLS